MTGLRVFLGRGWVGVRVRKLCVTVRSPAHKPLFSERNRRGCLVVPLPHGWRIVAAWTEWRAT